LKLRVGWIRTRTEVLQNIGEITHLMVWFIHD